MILFHDGTVRTTATSLERNHDRDDNPKFLPVDKFLPVYQYIAHLYSGVYILAALSI